MYIATSQVLDEEMRERVEHHQKRRAEMTESSFAHKQAQSDAAPFTWRTIEEPFELVDAIRQYPDEIVLVDCLTLWLTNWLLRYEAEPDCETKVMDKVEQLAQLIVERDRRVILVTNEVGDSVVPEYRLGRQFRDLAGWMNQRIAAACEEVFLVTAGIPVELKRIAYQWADGAERGK